MKSCLSLVIAVLIFLAFIGSAGLIWYNSNETKFSDGAEESSSEEP